MLRTTLIAAGTAALLATPALAGPTCSGDAEMLPMSQIVKSFEDAGGEIKLAKITSGGCYEIYGYEDGQKVEIYYDPRTGEELERQAG